MVKKITGLFLLWIIIPVGLAALLFYLGAGMISLCLYAFFILAISARIMIALWMRPLQCFRNLSDEIIRVGDTVKVVVRIRNPYWWPILWAYAEETLPARMRVDGTMRRLLFLLPRQTQYLFYSVTIARRGCHQLGPLVVETGDVFGLFRKTRVEKSRDFVTAVPFYTEIEEFYVGQRRLLGDFASERSLFDDPTRIRGIREYQRGDALKHIHWKTTAHTGKLMSKVFDPVEVAGATVVLDFHKETWEDAERVEQKKPGVLEDPRPPQEMALETACSICRYLWDGGWSVGFLSNGRDPLGIPGITLAQARSMESLSEALESARMGVKDDRLEPVFIPARRAPEQFSLIHENLGRLDITDGLRIEDALLDRVPHIERQQVLVILTGDVTDSLISGLLQVRALGYRMMVFIVRNTVAHDRAFEAFVPQGIDVFDLEHEGRLSEIATGRRFF
jgi:uncharacterized protein (DUF58 family)